MSTILTKRALNRALLERQMLIRRNQMPALEALEHLVGLQAQAPNPPYIGLWARLANFDHAELSRLIQSRQAVRIALMRSTIHLVSSRDCLMLRPLVQPFIERGFQGNHGKRLTGIDMAALASAGRSLIEEQPRTFGEISSLLAADERWQDRDPSAIAAAIRTYIPLVQVPPRGLWGESGQSAHTSAEAWLGSSLSQASDGSLETMLERYLAAFGPASVKDMQTWSGLTRLGEAVRRMRPRLRTFRDENGTELFDLPNAPLPDPDAPISARYMAEFDNALLSHADRTRIISEEDRQRVFTINGIIRSTFLIDGFVAGTWKIARERKSATLVIEPFRTISKKDMAELTEEGDRLLRFAAGDCTDSDIRFAE
ncbi:winged helix DNA-binding domain-containing protein [Cohnella cholangitidis]|uniref:Winged helix DNA-binding domain-containing protein n=1 Tax=Cohnella cholangitidis TaxID=2598458 RepID=A0A7G5BZX3_9BACL|nr:winged helix DNA-binding domain-containing protein [Cohnella cholangitidis]QMV42507.1 winged helix DNA-binding domain-containing protein [Cohnella cholangitidis]